MDLWINLCIFFCRQNYVAFSLNIQIIIPTFAFANQWILIAYCISGEQRISYLVNITSPMKSVLMVIRISAYIDFNLESKVNIFLKLQKQTGICVGCFEQIICRFSLIICQRRTIYFPVFNFCVHISLTKPCFFAYGPVSSDASFSFGVCSGLVLSKSVLDPHDLYLHTCSSEFTQNYQLYTFTVHITVIFWR